MSLIELKDRIGQKVGSRVPKISDLVIGLPIPFIKAREVSFQPDTETEEIIDPFKTLANLELKAGIMRDMIGNNLVEQPPIGRVRWLVRSWFYDLVSNGGIQGLDNLKRAISLAKDTNRRLILTPNHLADADHLVQIYLEGRAGLQIQNQQVFMAGVNMERRPDIKRFLRAEHAIYNVTPRDMNHLQTLIEKADEYKFGEEEKERLKQTRETFNNMRLKAKERVTETVVKGKNPLVVYIEGGRSYSGLLKRGHKDYAGLFPHDGSAIVVPVRVYGSRDINPPGKNSAAGKFLRQEMFLPWKRTSVSMRVGEPYLSSEVWKVWKIRREEIENGEEINPDDWVSANIANLDPDLVEPADIPLYKALMQRFAPERISPALAKAA